MELSLKQRQVVRLCAERGGQLVRVMSETRAPHSRPRPELWAHMPEHLPMKIGEARSEDEFAELRGEAAQVFAQALVEAKPPAPALSEVQYA